MIERALQVPSVSISGLSKAFGGTVALDDVNLTVNPGEIHALLGANGAGKSTLIKILAGVYKSDRGSVHIGGVALGQSARHGIAFVHQDLGLIDSMSIGENMAIGYGYPTRLGLIGWKAVRQRAASALGGLGVSLPLDLSVSALSGAEKAMVAIGRAIHDNPSILVLDEPTARLPEADVVRLFEVLRRLSARGTSILYVSHRLDEVLRLADAATVLRDGRNVACHRPVSVTSSKLVEDILGKVLAARDTRVRKTDEPVALTVDNLRVGHCGPIRFWARKGEILGLAGLRGAGHEDVGRAIAGVCCPDAGSVTLDGRAIRHGQTAEAISAGIGFTTSKRLEEAIACSMTVMENLFLNPGNFGRRALRIRDRASEDCLAAQILAPFHVRPANPCSEILSLSGGNQQKVVLARWAGQARYKLLVLEEPTMGVDVGAKAEIYRMLESSADAGMTCLVVSSDIEELVQICDRVLAFGRGRIAAELEGDELTIPALTHAVAATAATEPASADTPGVYANA